MTVQMLGGCASTTKSRNGAPSPKGRVVNGQNDLESSKKRVRPPPPSTLQITARKHSTKTQEKMYAKHAANAMHTKKNTHMHSGAPGDVSQVRIELATSSSRGPSYRFSTRYFWAWGGDGRWTTIISRTASAAGSHFCMTRLRRGLPTRSFSSPLRVTPTAVSIFWIFCFLSSMMASNILQMGDMIHWQNTRSSLPLSLDFFHCGSFEFGIGVGIFQSRVSSFRPNKRPLQPQTPSC